MTVWTPIFAPAVIAGVCLLVSWRAWRRKKLAPRGEWGGALAFAGAYFSAHVLLVGWPEFPPMVSADRLAWLSIAFGFVGVVQRWWGSQWYFSFPLRAAISVGLWLALLKSALEFHWTGNVGVGRGFMLTPESWIPLAILSMASALFWESLERLAAMRGGASLPLSLSAYCAVSAGVFFVAGSAAIAQLAGALAAAAGAALVLAWWAPEIRLSGGAMTVFATVYAGLLIRSRFFGELSVWSASILYLAPFALWFGERRRFAFSRPWKSALVRAGLIGAPALVALGLEWWLSGRASGESGGY